ncbi:trigger factor [Bacteroidota bacterium]
MDVSRENIDELNVILKVKIEKEDYEERVNKVLTDYRKKVKLDGFRPGKVPMGLVKKMYGTSILVDEINKIITESVSKNLTEDKLHILGEPIPSKDQKPIDWTTDKEFNFSFDLGLAPQFELNLSKKDKIPYYSIKVDEKIINSQKENIANRYGAMAKAEVSEEKSTVKGLVEQLDEKGQILENGIRVEDTMIHIAVIKDEKIQKKFIGTKIDDIITFDPLKAFPNETDLSSMLKIDKELVKKINTHFRITVAEINNFQPAELNNELFDKIYGEGKVKTIEEFEKLIIDDSKINLIRESEYKFSIDAKEKLISKTDFLLPDAFLKRWLLETNKTELTEEKIETDYPNFVSDLKWQLIKDKIVVDNEIKVEDEEILNFARQVGLAQFQQYGISNVPDNQLTEYANSIIAKEEEKRKIVEKVTEQKVINNIKEYVKIEEKEISIDKFNKLFTS